MNIVVHPTYVHAGYLNWLCDNYLIGGNGPGDRLHQFPEEVVEVVDVFRSPLVPAEAGSARAKLAGFARRRHWISACAGMSAALRSTPRAH